MALVDTTWYVSSVAYAAVVARPQNTAVAAGAVRRQFTAPAVNNERCFVCIVAGTTANVADATWVLTRGAKTTDGTVTWMECTGQPAANGDLASTATWAQVKAATPAVLGQIIKRSNNASYQICTTAGAMSASEPAFSDTAGVTTTDTTAVWTSLGLVGNFPAWGAPHARLANAYASTWGVAGNRFWVADNHAETQASSMTLTAPSSTTTLTTTICVDRTAVLPPVQANYNTGASISTTVGSNISFSATASGAGVYWEGLTINCGTGSGGSAVLQMVTALVCYVFKNCAFVITGTFTTNAINVGSGTTPNQVIWDNCTVQFSATAQTINLGRGAFEWRNTPNALVVGTIPTVLFGGTGNAFSTNVICRGVDFSAFSGKLVQDNISMAVPIVLEDCKLHASMTRYGASSGVGYAMSPVITVRCDSGATNYKSTRDEYSGSQVTETSITRVGGATDGTTPQSTKITTNAQATFLTPYRMLRLAQWNDVTGANRTVTVCGTVNSASLPNNDEIWMDVQYLGDAASPRASFKSTSKSHPLAAGAAVASDGSTWNGTTYTLFDIGTALGASLSNNTLTATCTANATNRGVRTLDYRSTGKYYFEVTIGATSGGDAIGIVEAAANYNPSGVNATTIIGTGSIFISGTGFGSLSAFVAGDVVSVAIDLTAKKAWFRKNGGLWNANASYDPATGVGNSGVIGAGNYSPFIGFNSSTVGDTLTANFGQTAYVYAVPSGYGNWATVWTPFKLTTTLTSPQPQMKGYIYASIRAAKASTTFYIDPQITLATASSTTSAEVAAFLARTSGLDTTHVTAYTALIDGLVADGIWAKLDMLHIYATQNITTALLNLVSTSYNGTVFGTPTFTVDRGYTGSGGIPYIATGFIPSSAPSPKFTRDSAHVSAWNLTNTTDTGNLIGNSNSSASAASNIHAKYTDGSAYFRITGSGATAGVAMSDARGHLIANRSASSAVQGYKNGISVLTNSDASQALCTFQFITLANNNNGSPNNGCSMQEAMASIGSSLSATDVTNFYNRLRTYMTAVGVP